MTLRAVKTPQSTPEIKSEVIDISPDFAAELLEDRNVRNRPLSRSTVLAYAKEMRSGSWTLTHQGIALDTEGVLLDGQHRLAAVVEAGVSVPMMVSYDLPPEAFATVDVGRRRTASDALNMAGLTKNAPQLGAVAKFLRIHDGLSAKGIAGKDAYRMTNQAVIDTVNKYGEPELQEAIRLASQVAKQLRSNVTAMSAFCYLAVNRTGVPADELRAQFLEPLRTGIGFTSETDPRLVLRNRLQKDSVKAKTDKSRLEEFSLIVHGWNSYREGRKLTRIMAPRDVPGIVAA